MILHNTTFVISPEIEQEFLFWIKERYLPAACKAKNISDALLSKIMAPPQADEMPDTVSYAFQFKAETLSDANIWLENVAGGLIIEQQKIHGENLLAFSTFMEII